MSQWPYYHGDGRQRDVELPEPPPFRAFGIGQGGNGEHVVDNQVEALPRLQAHLDRGVAYEVWGNISDAVSAALALRKPLLVTGPPGVGKSSLAYSVAYELKLGPVLVWPITSRSVLRDGLYDYDAIARLHDKDVQEKRPIQDYIKLGPLGTALLPWNRPRVLLIDELDKSDIDLPNDLLHVLEEGSYIISELERVSRPPKEQADPSSTSPPNPTGGVQVLMDDGIKSTEINRGRVRCTNFPMVIMTSNAEREFPPAFNRRCLRVNIKSPSEQQLWGIITKHLSGQRAFEKRDEIRDLLVKTVVNYKAMVESGEISPDQVLNAFQLLTLPELSNGPGFQKDLVKRLTEIILRRLSDG